ncbi:hypothetical protein KIN20_014593 [Parelaphostrongylus tenuis]|uniref:Uncharacterized protein n=1 Tax=Parelaphostrongylus tenuis TaxID=148309 RepID=A0AAD5MXJ2_PARTN|nr:hypothetical protein KIN20_014593 [Parelaphostrongylus tenuis]
MGASAVSSFIHYKTTLSAGDHKHDEAHSPLEKPQITNHNIWVHGYQDACMGKVVRFIEASSTGPPNRRAIGALSAAIQLGIRQTSTSSHHSFSTRVGEHPPSMPSITPASSTDRNRRKHLTFVSTVYDQS